MAVRARQPGSLDGVGQNFAEGFDEIGREREIDDEAGGAGYDGGAFVAQVGGERF